MMRLQDDNYLTLPLVSKKKQNDIRASTWHTGYRIQDTGYRIQGDGLINDNRSLMDENLIMRGNALARMKGHV